MTMTNFHCYTIAFLITLFIAAGCIASANSSTTPAFTGASGQEVDLSQLALTPGDIPFPVTREDSGFLPVESSGTLPVGSVERIYYAMYLNDRASPSSGTALAQVIIECSPGNASSVYYYLYRTIPETQTGGNYIRVLEHPGIGEKSFAFTTTEQYGPDGSYVMRGILFKKADVVEYIVLMYPEDDPIAINAIARSAAAKIQAGGMNTPAVQAPSPTKKPAPATRPTPAVTQPRAPAAKSKDGLLVWYDFEDNFQNTGVVKDKSGSGRDGVVTGTVNRAGGIAGTKGIAFTGRGYLQADDNPAAGLTEVTFSFWFKTADPTRNYKFASAAEWYGGPGTGWTMATHRPEFWADDGPEDLLVPAQENADNHFVADTWTHEAVVYDGSTMKEYTNGVLINTWEARGVPMSAGVPMAVGGWPQFSGYNYVGEMDEFRIYDRALNAGEISVLSHQS